MSDELPPATRRERTLELDRVVNFSDAVFAIAMTLLVLSLHLPLTLDTKYSGQALDNHLWHEFHDVLPNLFGYALSFAVISRTWLAHHRAFRVIERIDHTFINLNLLMLAFVALAPFPTEVFGTYPQSRTATIVYAASISAVTLTFSALWIYASNGERLIVSGTPRDFIMHSTWRGLSVPIVFLFSIPIALLFGPMWAQWSWLLIVPLRIVLGRRYGRITRLAEGLG